MKMLFLNDDEGTWETMLCEAAEPICLVLFAVGSGGRPERHLPLISFLRERGCTIVAPSFDRIMTPRPHAAELALRARRLRLALDAAYRPDLRVAGIGHSIGGTILLALAGARLWMGPGQELPITADKRLQRLVVMTSPMGYFQAPAALDAVHTPLLLWAGSEDTITGPSQALFLKDRLDGQVPVDLRIVEGAGHFSFMNTMPPQITDTLSDREAFLQDLAREIHGFIVSAEQ